MLQIKYVYEFLIIFQLQVLDTQDAQIDREIQEKFTNPPIQEVAAIKTKEEGERVSVKAIVERVSTKTI